MINSSLLMARLALAWYLLALLAYGVAVTLWPPLGIAITLLGCVAVAFALLRGYGHIRRVRLLGYKLSAETLANRHRRQIELPLGADESFALTAAIVGEVTRGGTLAKDHAALRLRAQVGHSGGLSKPAWRHPLSWFVSLRNQVSASLVSDNGTTSVVVICEPQCTAWSDWFRIDDGANLETVEAITHGLTRRVANQRHADQQAVAQTATEKELAIAKLRLLQAQLEPHFLYNTLASAQILTRDDPARAETMLGHLIDYLRRSLPRTDHTLSSLGEEL
ncbi:MAG: histidine kinase, partial [Xanthomonadales bacterium]|nr:histidine kinase [Xanthomonadales bacterium]